MPRGGQLIVVMRGVVRESTPRSRSCCQGVPVQPLPPTGQNAGIDVGLKVFLITADGEVVENPRHYRKAEKALQKAQRRISRRQKGSKRRRKAVALLAKKHQQVKRQRADFPPGVGDAARRRKLSTTVFKDSRDTVTPYRHGTVLCATLWFRNVCVASLLSLNSRHPGT